MTPENESEKANEVQAQKHHYPNGEEVTKLREEAGEIAVARTVPHPTRDEEGNQTTEYETTEIVFDDIEAREVNQYAVFEREFESFESTAASKSDSEGLRMLLVKDGEMEAIDATDAPEEDWVFRYDERGNPDGYSHESHDIEMSKKSRRVDHNRSTGSARLKIDRSVVDEHDAVYVIKYRDASGASRGNSSWSKFEPLRAVKLEGSA